MFAGVQNPFTFFFLKKNSLESGSWGKVLKALKKASSVGEENSEFMASFPPAWRAEAQVGKSLQSDQRGFHLHS